MKSQTINMTEGSTIRLILVFSIPMLIGNLFQQFYNLVDASIVGHLIGKDALASVGATSSITFFFFALCNGFGNAGGIITSQYFGEGNVSKVKSCIINTAYIMFLIPAIIGITAFFLSTPILRMLKTSDEILHDASVYLKINSLGLLLVSAYNLISSMLRSLGDSKTPLYFLIFSTILNAGLDYIFIKYFQMGVAGAAVATIISQFISAAGCLIFAINKNEYFKFQREDLRVDYNLIIKCLKLGVPLSLQFSLIAISCMALQSVVNNFGVTATAAFTATGRLEQIIHQPYQTICAALATFCGQNYGAKKFNRLIKGFHRCLSMMAIFTLIMFPIIQIFGKAIMYLFTDEIEVIEMGAKALKITSLFYIFLGVIYVSRGVLNGVGDSFFALLNGIVEVLGRFIVPGILTAIPFIGIWGIWWSVGIVWFLAGITAYMRYLYIKHKIRNNTFIKKI